MGQQRAHAEIITNYRNVDDRHLYTQGSTNFQHTPVLLPEDDFFVGVRFSKNRLFRGSYGMCDAPLGHIQWDEPSADHNYDEVIHPTNAAADAGNDAEEIEIQYGTGVKKVKAADNGGVLIPHIPVVSMRSDNLRFIQTSVRLINIPAFSKQETSKYSETV